MSQLDENVGKFMKAKDAARKLIQMDSRGQLDNYAKTAKNSGKMEYQDIPISESTNNYQQQEYISQQNMVSTPRNTNLPKEILESMTSNQIDTSALSVPGVGGSILDHLDAMTGGNITQQMKQNKQERIVETVNSNNNSNVDYAMIKMIVEDCMKKYSSALKKQILAENKNLIAESDELQAMKIGNKFSFITKKGDLYEAELKFIKNINER